MGRFTSWRPLKFPRSMKINIQGKNYLEVGIESNKSQEDEDLCFIFCGICFCIANSFYEGCGICYSIRKKNLQELNLQFESDTKFFVPNMPNLKILRLYYCN